MKCILKEGYIRRITERIKDKKKKKVKDKFLFAEGFQKKVKETMRTKNKNKGNFQRKHETTKPTLLGSAKSFPGRPRPE